MQLIRRLIFWLQDVSRLPWLDAVATLRERFREDRLALTASSLTFTTTIALVPLITVGLAIFSTFPMFAKFQDVLQKWLIESLIPDNIARQVLGYLNQFAGKASKLGVVGLAALFVTALALIFTIDRTLNSIWRVRTERPFAQRVLIYWAAITLGPLVLGASLSLASYGLSLSKGVAPGGVGLLLNLLQFVLLAGGMAAMFRYVPNTFVPWGHAWMGGLLVSIGMEVARRGLALYLSKVPTYSLVYGAFATVPILLVWIYMAWIIVLLGAALTAYVPSLLAGVPQRRSGPGWQFQLALEILTVLQRARHSPEKGQTMAQLCTALRAQAQHAETVLDALVALDWVGRLSEPQGHAPQVTQNGKETGARLVLLVEPENTALEPLMRRLLLPSHGATEKMWALAHWPACKLGDVITP
jgi:membrane protein